MISDIRHTALRRTICVISAPLYLAAVAICGALVAIDEAWVDVVAAWRGPRNTPVDNNPRACYYPPRKYLSARRYAGGADKPDDISRLKSGA